MSVTVADCLKLPSLRMGKVLAGKNGLNRSVNTVTVLEVIDQLFFDTVKPINNGDMVLTSFYSIKDNPDEQTSNLEYMNSVGDSCLVIYYLGIVLKDIHPSVLETADRLGFPLIVMPENRMDFFYNEVIGEVCEAIVRDRMVSNSFIEDITSQVSSLPENTRNMSTLLRIISANLKITILLSNISSNNVDISKWPISNEIRADDICALYEKNSTKDEYCIKTEYNGMPLDIYRMPFSAFEYRNFSVYAADEFGTLTLDDMFKIVELLQIFSKLWDLDSDSILQNALLPAIIEGDEQKMHNLAGKLCIDISTINTTMIVRPDFSGKSAKEQVQIKRDMINAFKKSANTFGKNIIVDAYGLYVIGFATLSLADNSDAEYVEELIQSLDQAYPYYTISVFPNDDNATDVQKTYLLYSEYISKILKVFPHKKQLTYGDLLFTKHCYDMITSKEGEYRVCYNIMKPLLNAPEHKELLETLSVYHLDADCEVKKTSEILFLHRNTVQYRLNKIREVTNFRANDILDSYLIHMGIACYRLEKNMKQMEG